jgi:hypothetical protein
MAPAPPNPQQQQQQHPGDFPQPFQAAPGPIGTISGYAYQRTH